MIKDRRTHTNLSDEERFKLWFGPYETPIVEIGDWVECEIHGRVLMTMWWQRGHILWPCAGGRPKCGLQGIARPIVFEGLARAIRHESSLSIQHEWGVSVATVQRWRKTLGVEQFNEGTKQLYRAFTKQILTPEVSAEAVRLAAAPAVRRKAVETLYSFRDNNGSAPPWTREEEKVLGTAPDRVVAAQLGRSLNSVERHRKEKGIRYYSDKSEKTRLLWMSKQMHDSVPVETQKLKALRLTKGLETVQVAHGIEMPVTRYEALENSPTGQVNFAQFGKLLQMFSCNIESLISLAYLEALPRHRKR